MADFDLEAAGSVRAMDPTLQELFQTLSRAADAIREAVDSEDVDRIDGLYTQSRLSLKELSRRLSALATAGTLDAAVRSAGDAAVAQWQGLGVDIHALSERLRIQLDSNKKIHRNVGRIGGVYAPTSKKSGKNLRYDVK